MKILSGQFKGRPIDQPKTRSVRPMSEKVRAALFDAVGVPENFVVLDVYAGSGAVGFEALSRGAALVDAIEANQRVARTIEQNATKLDIDWGYELHVMTVETWLASPRQQPPEPRYDLIIADPPYSQLDPDTLERLVHFLKPDSVLVLSHSSRLESPNLPAAALIKTKVYGDSALSFYASAT